MFWRVPPAWAGETAVILGGGPSLDRAIAGRLDGRRVIAVNNAWEVCPRAEILYWNDLRWWRTNARGLDAFGGRWRVTRAAECRAEDPGVRLVRRGRRFGLEVLDRTAVRGTHSGAGAINLAVHLGARRIVLLGFDMRAGADGRCQWHERHAITSNPAEYGGRMIPEMIAAAFDLRRLGVEVVNGTPGSALRCFPVTAPEAALGWV